MARVNKLLRLMGEYRQLVQDKAPSLEVARLEKKIWDIVKPTRGVEVRHRDWFKQTFGGNTSYYEARWYIYKSRWAHPLFEEVDSGRMPWRTALSARHRINSLARRHKQKHTEVLKKVLEQYDGTFRSIAKATVEGETVIDVSDGRDSLNKLSKTFKANVKQAANLYVTEALHKMNVDPEERRKLAEDFVIDVDQVSHQLMKNLFRCRKGARENGLIKIGIRRFKWACEVLGIEATFGQDVDLKLVGRMVRRRARDLHPDRNKNPHAKEEYDNVNRANEILLAYCRFRTKGNGHGITTKENTQSP